MSDKPSNEKAVYTAVVCPTCRTRVFPAVREERHRVRCPDCHVPVVVPSRAEVIAAEREKKEKDQARRKTENVGTYGLTARAAEEVPVEQTVHCERCRNTITMPVVRESKRVKCSKCGNRVYVPGHLSAPEENKSDVKQVNPATIDLDDDIFSDLGLQDSAPSESPIDRRIQATGSAQRNSSIEHSSIEESGPTAEPETHYLDRFADIRRESEGEKPKSLYLTGVFGFPFRRGAFPRWGYLTLGCVMSGALVAGIVHMLMSVSGYGGVAIAFFAMPLVWVGFWTLSYGAACAITIIEDTANGLSEVVNWMEPNWKEWVPRLMMLAYLATLTVTTCMLIARGVYLATGWFIAPLFVTMSFLFPFLLLSALEVGSTLVPFSTPVTVSLRRSWKAWLGFLTIVSLIGSGLSLAMYWGINLIGPATIPILGPAFSTYFMVYCRLLGRLGWAITNHDGPSKKKRKKRRKSSSKSSG